MDYIEKLEESEVLKHEDIAAVYLYGSQATGNSHSGSDVDIGLVLEEDSEMDFAEQSELERSLTEEMGRKVDLRVLNGADNRFIYNVLKNGDLVLSNDEGKRIEFEHRVMRNYLDMKPFYDEYDRKVRERITG